MIQSNLIRLFEDSIRMNWDRPAMSDYGHARVYTYGDVAERIEKIHLILRQAGIEKNDRVALIGKNSCNWAMTYVATVTYGAIVVPILQDFKPGDVTHIVNHSESKLIFAGDPLWEQLDIHAMKGLIAAISVNDFSVLAVQTRQQTKEELKAALKQAKKEQDNKELEAEDVAEEIPIMDASILSPDTIDQLFEEKYQGNFHRDLVRYDYKDNSEIASINYTSGTTGFSKGVVTPLNALAGNVSFGLSTKIAFPGSRFVCFLPLAHAYGCAFDFLSNFCAGGYTCYYGRPLAAQILLRAFAEVKPTTIFTVPLIIEKIYKKMIQPLLEDPTKSWVLSVPLMKDAVLMTIRKRLVKAFGGEFTQMIIGGAALNADVEAFFHKIKFPFTVGYGMTECAPLISFAPYNEFIPSSCGRVLPLMKARIANPNAQGVGEIEVTGENVMRGYYKNEEATALTFSEDGWLKTGDLGVIDENGNIFIKGRNKTMLLGPSGQNIYPEELEDKLNNMPYVLESLVMQREDKIVALVYPDMEAADANKMTQEQIRQRMEQNRKLVNAQLAAYEQIHEIRIYPHEFEKTPKKSIKRYLYNANMGE